MKPQSSEMKKDGVIFILFWKDVAQLLYDNLFFFATILYICKVATSWNELKFHYLVPEIF